MAEVDIDIGAIVEAIRGATIEGITEYAEEDLLPASNEKCPVKSGLMRSTGHVEPKEDEVDLVYGPLAYVLKQYFDATLNHPNGGEDHWAEKAAVETESLLADRVASKISEVLG